VKSPVPSSADPERLLMLAPSPAEARNAALIASSSGYTCLACPDVPALARALDEGAGVILVADEVLRADTLAALAGCLSQQPEWSDVPVLLLARSGRDLAFSAEAVTATFNLTVVEHPDRITALAGALRTAIRSRRRQYELRDRLDALARARHQLDHRNSQLRLCLETAALGLHWVRRDGIITWANDAIVALLGYPLDRYVGRHMGEFFDDRAQADAVVERLARRERIHQHPAVLRAADGSLRHVLIDSSAQHEDRRFVHTQCFIVDITERVHAQAAVRELKNHLQSQLTDLATSEARLAAVANTVPSIIWNAAPNGTVTWASDRWYAYTGLTPEEFARRGARSVLHPADLNRCRERWKSSLRDGAPYEIEIRNRGHDGQYRWFLTRAVPVRDDRGRLLAWCGSATDIHDRKTAEETTQRRNRRLALLSAAASNMLAVTDWDGVVRTLFDTIATEFDLDVYFSYTLNEDGRSLVLDSCAGVPHPAARDVRTLDLGAAICGVVAERRERIVAARVQAGDDPRAALIRSLGVRAYVCTPLLAGDRLLGTLSFGTRSRDEFEPDEVEFFSTVCHYVAMARERLRAEAELRESEGRFRALVDASAQMVWTAAPDGTIVEDSRSWRAFTGQTYAQWKGTGWLDAIHPDDRDRTLALWREAVAARRSIDTEYRLQRADGGWRWTAVRAVPLIDGTGALRAWVGMNTDITERKRAENALEESERRYRLLVHALPAAVYTCDAEGRVALFNQAAVELWGREPRPGDDQWCGSYRIFTTRGEPLPLDQCPMAVTLREGRAVRGAEVIIERPAGERRHVLPYPEPLFDDDGRLVGAVNMLIDITDMRRAEADLKESRDVLTLAMRAGRMGAWWRDLDTGRVWWSEELVDLFGMPPGYQPGPGGGIFDFIHDEERETMRLAVDRALETGDDYVVEFRFRHATGEWRWMEGRGRAVTGAAGRPARLYGLGIDITDRKLAEQDRAFLAAIVAHSDDAIVSKSLAGIITSWNDAAQRLFGYTADEAVGHPMTTLIPHGRRDEESRILARIRCGERVEPYDTARLTKDGRTIDVSVAVSPLRDEAGRVIGASNVSHDITERKRTEAALRRSEMNFRALADNMSQLAWMCDVLGHAEWYNRRWYEFTGTTWEEMKGDGWRKIQHPAHAERVARTLERARESEDIWEDIFPLRGRDGEYRWFLSRAVPIRDAEGRIVRWFGTNTDITEQREAAERVRASEERFRLMADASPALIWMSGPDKKRTWFNRPWLEFTGRAMDQELGDGWTSAVHPEDLARCTDAYASSFDERRESRVEFRLRRHDGQFRWLLDHARPLHAGGAFTGYIGSCIDVTDQVLARQSLERQQSLLEEAVYQRTIELERSSQRLRISERMASLGTLSAGLGHDMGNLLVPIRIRLESLSRADLAPELREDVEALRASANYLQSLASGLRTLAVDPAREPCAASTELPAWWAEAALLLRNAVPRGITVEAAPFAPGLCAAISRAALTQVVFNLVQNAGEVMRARGHGRVTITAGERQEGIVIEVTDDGPGMSEEVRARCFEPFFTTKTRTVATGLGLALVYGLLSEAGGTIDARSTPGEGTTFVLSLPRGSLAGPGHAAPGSGRVARIQVKDERLRAFVAAELRSLAFDVRTNGDGRHADLLIGDDAAFLDSNPHASAVLLCEDAVPHAGVVVVGPRPTPRAVRDAIVAVARAARPVDGR